MKRTGLLLLVVILTTLLPACKKENGNNNTAEQWSSIATINGGTANRMSFPSENVGYICGSSNGFLAKTTNGGATWNSLPSPDGYAYYDVCFINDNVGYLGSDDDIGRIYKTVDGGQTWTISCYSSINSVQVKFINRIYFVDEQHGFAVTRYGGIVRTVDGGQSWEFATVDHPFNLELFYGITFTNTNTGFVVGTGSTILKTTDGGANWVTLNNYTLNTTVNNLSSADMYDIHHFNDNELIISAGSVGTFRSADGGNTWTIVSPYVGGHFAFDSPTHGFMAGIESSQAFHSIYETSDKGQTWTAVDIPGVSIALRDISMVKPGLGYGMIISNNVFKYQK